MPLTTEQKIMIEKKEKELPEALRRDKSVNYLEGYFFITLNTRKGSPSLCYITGKPGVEQGSPDAPRCVPTKLGEKVWESWLRTTKVYPFVEILAAEVMPEHFHGLLRLLPGNKNHLGKIVGGFMSGCTHGYWDILGIDWRENRFDQGARALKEDRDRHHTTSMRGPALFVRGYNDVEPITPEQVEIKREYIRMQAEKRLIKMANRDLFRIQRRKHSPNWTDDVVSRAIASDRYFASDARRCRETQASVLALLNRTESKEETGFSPLPALDFVGNMHLLTQGRLLPLICHRADADDFPRQAEAVMKAAREGAVIVSAFISPKERELRRAMIAEQLPFIEIMNNGFSEKYQPGKQSFFACGEGCLLQVTCWRYVYQKDARVSREACLVMNQLARIITKQHDSWWKG